MSTSGDAPRVDLLPGALVRLEQKGWIEGAWQTTQDNREASLSK